MLYGCTMLRGRAKSNSFWKLIENSTSFNTGRPSVNIWYYNNRICNRLMNLLLSVLQTTYNNLIYYSLYHLLNEIIFNDQSKIGWMMFIRKGELNCLCSELKMIQHALALKSLSLLSRAGTIGCRFINNEERISLILFFQ